MAALLRTGLAGLVGRSASCLGGRGGRCICLGGERDVECSPLGDREREAVAGLLGMSIGDEACLEVTSTEPNQTLWDGEP